MIKIGVICPSEIAFRRFMPALKKSKSMIFIGIGVSSVSERFMPPYPAKDVIERTIQQDREKAQLFIDNYGGKIFNSYEEIVTSNEIDAIYIPLPPALHYKWSLLALKHGKHVFVEKPATISSNETKKLVEYAKNKKLAIHENYMFLFHKQIAEIDDIIKSGEIGSVRLIRILFGFPKRESNDFRYNKSLGGGALIDAGGYPIKYASHFLGDTSKVSQACINYVDGQSVDIHGSGVMINDKGLNVQFAYGMDNDYRCELEVWGSRGTLKTNRVLTAPDGFVPTVVISKNGLCSEHELSSDDTFSKSLAFFGKCIASDKIRELSYSAILRQSLLVDEFRKMSQEEKNEL